MKNLALALLCLGTSAFATNGNHFIGVSPAGTAMGGTGVANFTNSIDALHKNPALLTNPNLGKKVNAEVAFLYIKNNASVTAGDNAGASGLLRESTAGSKFSPSFGASYSYNEKLSVGIGLLTFGGAVVDYAGDAELNQLKTHNSLIRLIPAVSYRFSDFATVGISPYLSYGSLSLNHSNPPGSVGTAQTNRAPHAATGIGGLIGGAIHPMNGLTIGLTYNFESNLTYKEVMNLDAFGPAALSAPTALATAALDDIQAQQPQEIALGVGYMVTQELTVTADYRNIAWNSAKAFRELGWQNQNIIALGAQYQMHLWKFRAGFNYGKSPIRDGAAESPANVVDFQGHSVFPQSISVLDLVAFPAFTDAHITFGAGYEVNTDLRLDLDVVLGLSRTVMRSGTGANPLTGAAGGYLYTGTASQFSIGLGGVYTL